MSRRLMAVLSLLPLLLCACAPDHSVKRVSGRAGTGLDAVGVHEVAVGGVVVAAGVTPAGPLGDEAGNAAELYEQLRRALPGTTFMPRAVVEDLADPATLAGILDDYAHLGQADAARLRRLAVDLGGPRRLALVRVEGDELSFGAARLVGPTRAALPRNAAQGFQPVRGYDGAESTLDNASTNGERRLTATLDILDLDSGAVLWSARATVKDGFRSAAIAPQNANELRLAGADSTAPPARYERLPGTTAELDGAGLLGKCLGELAGALDVSGTHDRKRPKRLGGAAEPLR
jgi:hypothetical protein